MDWSQISQNLASLPNNPLFNFGLGMLSTPYQRTPVSFGQVLGNGVAQMDYARQMQAKQQQADMQAKMLQLKYQDAQAADQAQQAQADARQKYGATLSPDEQTLFNADPEAYITAHYKNDASKPIFDAKDGGFVDPRTHAFTPITVGTGVPVPASVPRVGMSGYQATVPGANGHNVSFNFPPGTPQQVIAAAQADAVARGDIAPNAIGAPMGPAQPSPEPQSGQTTLAAWRAAHAPAQGTLPAGYQWNADRTGAVRIPGLPPAGGKGDVIQQRVQQFQELESSLGKQYDPDYKSAYLETGAMPSLAPDAAYNAAWKYLLTGQQQRFYGSSGAADMTMVQNVAARIAKENGISPGDMESQAGREKALQASLVNIQKQGDVMDKQETAMHNNMDVVNDYLSKIGNGNYKDLNALRNAIRLRMGNKDVAAFNTALNSVATDYGKIMSGATGATGASDTELQQARKLMDPSMSPDQIHGVFDALNRDAQGQVSASSMKERTLTGLLGKFAPSASANITGHDGAQGAPIPQQAVLYLKSHPATRAQFDEQFGAGAADKVLGH